MPIKKSKNSALTEPVPVVDVQAMVNAFLSEHIDNLRKLPPLSGYQSAEHQYMAQCSCGWQHLAPTRAEARRYYMTHIIQEAQETGPTYEMGKLVYGWILKGRPK